MSNINYDAFKMSDGDYDFNGLRDAIKQSCEQQGLRDEYVRMSYGMMLTENQKISLLEQAVTAKSAKKLLSAINAGVPLDYECITGSKKCKRLKTEHLPSLLNQAINEQDYDRVNLLLSAGAKPVVDAKNPFYDAFYYAIFNLDATMFVTILSFIDDKIPPHWAFLVLDYLQNNNIEEAKLMEYLLALKLEQQKVDLTDFIKKGAETFSIMMEGEDGKYFNVNSSNYNAKDSSIKEENCNLR